MLKSKLRYSNPFRNARVLNERRSLMAAESRHNFHFLPNFNSFKSDWTDVHQIFMLFRGICAAINARSYNARRSDISSVSEHYSKELRRLILTSAKKPPKLISYHSNIPWVIAKQMSIQSFPHISLRMLKM